MIQPIQPPEKNLARKKLKLFLFQLPPTVQTLTNPQLLVKGLGAWFPTEEILERAHLFLATPALEDGVAVASALGRVHRVRGEDGMKHVG